MMKFIFCMHINIEVFCKVIPSIWVSVTRHAHSTQNKVCISLQYPHRRMGDEVDFLPANKHKRFLQDDSIALGMHRQTDPKYQKQPVYNIFAKSQGKHEGLS